MISKAIWWLRTLGRNFPKRAGRLAGVLAAGPVFLPMNQAASWLHALSWNLFDLAGGPETFELLLRTFTQVRPLTSEERNTAEAIFGPRAIQYGDVRIANGGVLEYAFRRNNNRAFATWHTVNLPDKYSGDLPLLIHELTHVYQYERIGSVYIGQGLWAQRKHGRAAYDYKGMAGLLDSRTAGRRFCDYNREQQGQIVQDYCARLRAKLETIAYDPFIEEMRAGLI